MSKLASSYEPLYFDSLCIQLERPGTSKRRNPDRSVFGYGAPVKMNDFPIGQNASGISSGLQPETRAGFPDYQGAFDDVSFVVDMGISRYAGKKQGELSLLRKMWDILSPGDILLTGPAPIQLASLSYASFLMHRSELCPSFVD